MQIGWFSVWLGHRAHTISDDFNRNYASILYQFRVTANYLSKVAEFNPLRLHLASLLGPGVTPLEFRRVLWHRKIAGLSCVVACVILWLAV